jgi:hypothetical protein
VRRFEARSCKPTSRDLPSSLVQHRGATALRTECDRAGKECREHDDCPGSLAERPDGEHTRLDLRHLGWAIEGPEGQRFFCCRPDETGRYVTEQAATPDRNSATFHYLLR